MKKATVLDRHTITLLECRNALRLSRPNQLETWAILEYLSLLLDVSEDELSAQLCRPLIATDIEWDTTDSELEPPEELPTEIEIPMEINETERISDYLTEKTGYCHKGFALSIM